MLVQSFFLRYLIMPVIVVITASILTVSNKKNQFVNNKKLITGMLIISASLALPGLLGLLKLDFMPWGYIICQIFYLCTGSLFVYLMTRYYPTQILERKVFILIALFISCLLAYYLYQLLFNWLSDIEIGLWAASSIFNFIIPLLFWWTYVALISIPNEIYKIWQYPDQAPELDMDHLDFDKMLVLELEVYKNTTDDEPIKVKVKAPENMQFGNWFYKFIEDYQLKFPKSSVKYANDLNEPFKWIFFIKTSFFKRNHYIDPDLDILQNQITEKATIYAKRVSEDAVAPSVKGDDSIFI
jgi:hypothetical protein